MGVREGAAAAFRQSLCYPHSSCFAHVHRSFLPPHLLLPLHLLLHLCLSPPPLRVFVVALFASQKAKREKEANLRRKRQHVDVDYSSVPPPIVGQPFVWPTVPVPVPEQRLAAAHRALEHVLCCLEFVNVFGSDLNFGRKYTLGVLCVLGIICVFQLSAVCVGISS